MKWLKNILYNNKEQTIELVNPEKLKKWTSSKVNKQNLKLLKDDIVKDTIKFVRRKHKIKSTFANNKRILLELIRITKNVILHNFFKFYLYDTIHINNPLSIAITILRVWGIESFTEDTFIIYEKEIKNNWWLSNSRLKEILLDKEILTTLINFIRCNNSLEAIPLASININSEIEFLLYINEIKMPIKVKNLINRVYNFEVHKQWRKESITLLHQLFFAINELKSGIFNEYSHLYKMWNYEVLELLKDTNWKLYWFNVHFSNWSIATYTRTENNTMAMNISFNKEWISFFIGDIHLLTNMYIYNKKPLYEIGITWRYNEYWYWRPLIAMKWEDFQKQAEKMSEDENIQWIIFYAMCSCTYNIEFVIKTKIKLEEKFTTLQNWISFYRCDYGNENLYGYNEYIYDCNISFDKLDEEEIRKKLSIIKNTISNMIFIYDEFVYWELKYKIRSSERWVLNTKLYELNIFLWENLVINDIISSSISWYNNAISEYNIFNKFLNFVVCIETLAIWIYENYEDFNLPFKFKKEDESKLINRVYKKKKDLFKVKKEIINDINKLYRMYSISSKINNILKLVFSEKSDTYKLMYKKVKWKNIYSIRSLIAHWTVFKNEEKYLPLVQHRIYDVFKIANEFIWRVIYRLESSKSFEGFNSSNLRTLSISMNTPKGTLFCSSLKFLPKNDWKIKSEWLDR